MGIQTKLTGPVLIGFLFFALLIHFYWAPSLYSAAKVEIIKQLHGELTALDDSLIRYLLENNYAPLYAALKQREIAHQGKWRHLTLFDDNQTRIYPLFPDKDKDKHVEHYFSHTHPILLEGEQLGVIKLDVDWREEFEQAQNRIYNLEGHLLSTVIVLVFFTVTWQYLIIIKPIRYLQRAVSFMTKGIFSVPLPKVSHDEIGQLTLGFDQMRQTITTTQQQLKQANDETQKAFAELADKNVELHNEIGERIKIQQRLNLMATHDELTTLPNRYLLKQEAIKVLSAATRYKHNVGIMFIDLDGFKVINDNHSHKTGDCILVEISLRISAEIRNIDTVGRVGGDEFVVILPDCHSLSNLKDIASRIVDKIKQPFESIEITETVSASIGIAVFPDNGQDFDVLLNKADAAMYQAKKLGKNQFHNYIENHPYTDKS